MFYYSHIRLFLFTSVYILDWQILEPCMFLWVLFWSKIIISCLYSYFFSVSCVLSVSDSEVSWYVVPYFGVRLMTICNLRHLSTVSARYILMFSCVVRWHRWRHISGMFNEYFLV